MLRIFFTLSPFEYPYRKHPLGDTKEENEKQKQNETTHKMVFVLGSLTPSKGAKPKQRSPKGDKNLSLLGGARWTI